MQGILASNITNIQSNAKLNVYKLYVTPKAVICRL